MENTSDTKRKSGMELEVKDGALLWQSIEIDESKTVSYTHLTLPTKA